MRFFSRRADPRFEAIVPAVTNAAPWQRAIYAHPSPNPSETHAPGPSVVRLGERDTQAVEKLSDELEWISDTLDGPSGLASSGLAFGIFDGSDLVSVAVSFFVGERYEELGVVTEDAHRGRGHSTACAAAAIRGVISRGRAPCWSTTPDNAASRRVAEKLGFRQLREGLKYVVGEAVG